MELLHNASNPITADISRVDGPDGPYVRKVITCTRPSSHVDWSCSLDPSDWRYWRREAHVYEEGLQQAFAPEGLRGPELLRLDDRGDTVELRLEAVDGASGVLPVETLADIAERLGAAQGRLAHVPVTRPWLARGFVGDHIASKHVAWGSLHDDRCWDHPLVASNWSPSLRAGLVRLTQRRSALLSVLEGVPRTLCHLDFWGHNLVVAEDGPVVLDWACLGHGALGEDLSNLVVEAVLDGLLPAEGMREVGETLLEAYTRGVTSAGGGEPSSVRTGFLAAAVKWVWLGPLHLARALSGEHHVYGGGAEADPDGQYQARGRALAQVVAWADEALGG
jgi:hypothetical protein